MEYIAHLIGDHSSASEALLHRLPYVLSLIVIVALVALAFLVAKWTGKAK